MRILCSFPERLGDLLWAMPTLRAISDTFSIPVDLVVSSPYSKPLIPLLAPQPYISSVWAEEEWVPVGDQHQPKAQFPGYDQTFHLHYLGWPRAPLPEVIWNQAKAQAPQLLPLQLDRPWITADPYCDPVPLVCGFSEEYFETKVGLVTLLQRRGLEVPMLAQPKGRWATEAGCIPTDWPMTARSIATCKVFLGDLSSMAVLAKALGKRRVLVEPNPNRWNPIFQHPDQRLLLGGDGKETWDSRHLWDALKEAGV